MKMKANNPVKILLVDDLPENLFALELILCNDNYKCVKAHSGNEALKILLHEQDFAIILMDVQMPEMDGFETVELIREIETLKNVPIIFLTASMDNAKHIFKGYQAGGVDYMIKPLIPEILTAKVAVFVELYLKKHELLIQNEEKEKQAEALRFANKKLLFQSDEKEKREAELVIANKEMAYQNEEKEKRADELLIANKELVYQNEEKEKRAAELVIADKELDFQNEEKEKRKIENIKLEALSNSLKEAKMVAELATLNAEEAKGLAERALQSKQQFLSNMSHEIRTPMNAIIGFTKVLMKTDLAPPQKEYLDAIKVSGDGLLVLINDILDLAKTDAGKMTFEEKPFKIEFSIATMHQVFDLKLKEKNLELVKEYDNKIPVMLLGDAARLHQILLNLLGNAIKFTTKGKIIVAVRLLHEDKKKATIEFAITDTGTGIPEDKLEFIFENFQQATSSTSSTFGGTGLGLAICKQLVEKQGGSILVKSKVDEGSTFSFTLSFQKSNIENKKASGDVELDKEIKDIRILVVEDIKLNQLLMTTILDDFKFKYDIADNGEIAIEKLQTETYDIILMDLQMPRMNGFEATEYIRNTLKLKIPIIALTADVTQVDVEKCKAIGMNDYVSKPLDERILYTKIIELLKS